MSAGKSKKEEPVYLTDEQIAELEKQHQQPEYLSDEQMAQMEAGQEPSLLSQLGKSTTEMLPELGATLGSGLGFVSPVPGGTIGGAAVGGYAGKALKNVIEQYAYDKPKTNQEIILSPFQEAANAASSEVIGGVGVPMALNAGARGLKSVTSSLSKIPEKVMETYYKHGPEVDKIPDLMDATEAIRQKATKGIEAFKSVQNAKITKAVEAQAGEMMDLAPSIKILEENASKLDPIVDASKIKKIQEQIDLMRHVSDAEGKVTAKQGYALMKDLQEKAEYIPPGQAFKRKDFIDITFQRAATFARKELNRVAPAIGKANEQLGKVRRMEKTFPRTILKEEGSIAPIMGVGTGENLANIRQVRKLEGVIGQSLLPDMEKIAAAKYFTKAGIIPGEKTGSSIAPIALAALGGGAGYLTENKDYALGGLALGALASPAGIKLGINAARKATELGVNYSPLATIEAARMMMSRAIQAGMHPSEVDKEIVKNQQLKPTEKAQLRNENAKGSQ
jgi:hypothetical protein